MPLTPLSEGNQTQNATHRRTAFLRHSGKGKIIVTGDRLVVAEARGGEGLATQRQPRVWGGERMFCALFVWWYNNSRHHQNSAVHPKM